ncbi:MAG TPA: TIGR04551 family protein [Polyangiaceae bacterium]|nr:TIGR04551 family protein [Polyangiaceae bacterium]
MKQASFASLLALGFLAIPALAEAQQKAPAAAPEGAPKAAPEAPKPTDAAKPKPSDAPKADSAAPATDSETAPDAAGEALPEAAPAPAPAPVPGTPTGGFNPLPAWPEPSTDAAELKRQNSERPREGALKSGEHEVFAEDWWTHARPLLELHGNFRVRSELFYQFSLGRRDSPTNALWPQPADNYFTDTSGTAHGPATCTADEVNAGTDTTPTNANHGCKSGTQAGANLRFRLNPELHVSDNLRVISQIDLLDNVVLGSTPGEYQVTPSSGSGYAVAARSGYTPIGFYTSTTSPPTSGVNSLRDSIAVKRVWAEFATPVGELRFGRMPNHWGLGIVNNSGDGYDDNYQSTIDRIQFTTGIKPLDLYVTGAWDFVNEGATSDNFGIPSGQPYDVAQADDVTEYMLQIAHRKSRELTRLSLAKGDVVINGGIQVTYRKQQLADDQTQGGANPGTCVSGAAAFGCAPGQQTQLSQGFARRGASSWTPDLWLQVLYKKFRFETEAVTIQGNLDNITDSASPAANIGYKIRQYGLATEIEQRLVEDKLHLGFNFGWASGDSDVQGLSPPYNAPENQHGDRTDSTFRFNPAYSIDLILYRNILSRVEGTYYFRPNVSYDFLRDSSGQKLGGGIAAIWSRASEFVQAPGHARDLGVELNGSVYFQSKDGALNDDPTKMGGFFTKLEYGVLFPMQGLGYSPQDAAVLQGGSSSTSAAQTLRWYMGVFF